MLQNKALGHNYTNYCVSMGCLQKDNNCIVGLSYIALQKLKEHLNSTMSAVLYVAKAIVP